MLPHTLKSLFGVQRKPYGEGTSPRLKNYSLKFKINFCQKKCFNFVIKFKINKSRLQS